MSIAADCESVPDGQWLLLELPPDSAPLDAAVTNTLIVLRGSQCDNVWRREPERSEPATEDVHRRWIMV